MALTPDEVRTLLEAFDSSAWQEMTLHSGNDRVQVSRRAGGPAAPSAAPFSASGHRVNPGLGSAGTADGTVRSPSVGVFRRGVPSGAAETVETGSVVRRGQVIGFVDVMGRVIPVEAGVTGTLSAVLPEDGATVEYGEAVALLVPDQGA